jgi:hypothetical protein
VHKNTKGETGIEQKRKHKIKWTNRVKGKNLILNLWAELDGSPGSKTVPKKTGNNTAKYERENKRFQN